MAQQNAPKATPPQAPPPGREVAKTEDENKKDAMTDLARFFARKDVMDRIEQVLPKHLRPDRMIRIGLHAAQKSPNLWQVKPMELFGGILFFASVGLEPNSPLAHGDLVPVPKRAKNNQTNRYETIGYTLETFIRYGGWLELMRRSGSLLSVHCDIVMSDDEFKFHHGSGASLRHVPAARDEDPDLMKDLTPDWAYSFAQLRDGVEHFEVLPWGRILAIRNQAPAYRQARADIDDERSPDWKKDKARKAPWIAWPIPMAKKTMLLQMRKWVPISVEVMNALNLESAQEQGRALNLEAVVGFDLKDGMELPVRDDAEPKQIEQSGEKPIVVSVQAEAPAEKVEAEKPKPEPKKAAPPQAQRQSTGDQRPEPPTIEHEDTPAPAAKPKPRASFA